MKKILYLFYIIVISLVCSYLIKFDSKVIINVYNYEFITSVKFIFIAFIIFLILNNLLINIIDIIFSTSKSKYTRKINQVEKKYNNYINTISDGFLYLLNNNVKLAEKSLHKANKIIKHNDLSSVLETQIAYNQDKHEKVGNMFNLMKSSLVNKEYVINTMLLKQAIRENNNQNIIEYANKVLEHIANDSQALTSLYFAYKNNQEWKKCKQLLKTIKKENIFDKNDLKSEQEIIDNELKKQQEINKTSTKQNIKKIFDKINLKKYFSFRKNK